MTDAADPALTASPGGVSAAALAWLAAARVARLATADAAGRPHVVPVCFALAPDAAALYIAIDEKPKDLRRPLKRLRNLAANPHAALVADRYDEDWRRLGWVMVRASGEILPPGAAEHAAALVLLRAKYPQYRTMALEDLPGIALRIARVAWWGRLAASE
jgi:coenzyme F420-0:L-glutamate ligase/coenzyme F420-1:gamma-L-glutamate ligase